MDGLMPFGVLPGFVPLSVAGPLGSSGVYPLIGDPADNREVYLKSLDSDTRAYVLNHVGEYSSRAEMQACVDELRGYK